MNTYFYLIIINFLNFKEKKVRYSFPVSCLTHRPQARSLGGNRTHEMTLGLSFPGVGEGTDFTTKCATNEWKTNRASPNLRIITSFVNSLQKHSVKFQERHPSCSLRQHPRLNPCWMPKPTLPRVSHSRAPTQLVCYGLSGTAVPPSQSNSTTVFRAIFSRILGLWGTTAGLCHVVWHNVVPSTQWVETGHPG